MSREEKEIERFLGILDDPKIRQKILDIVSMHKNTSVCTTGSTSTDELQQLQNLLKEKTECIERLENSVKKAKAMVGALTDERDSANQILNEERQKTSLLLENNRHDYDVLNARFVEHKELADTAQRKFNELLEAFEAPLGLYQRYIELDAIMRERLSGIISDRSIVTFISSCSRYSNLESLWDYIKTILDKESNDNIRLLLDIHEYYFDLFNASSDHPVYVWNAVEIGDRYNDEEHIRGQGSQTQGFVQRIVLRGYSSYNTRKVIRKSVVIAG